MVRTPALSFRPLARPDLVTLSQWLTEPHVARWWRDPSDTASIEAAYVPCIDGEDPTEMFILEADGRDAGLFQRYLIADEPDWAAALRASRSVAADAAGIDYLIGDPAMTGRGLGAAAIRQFTALTFDRYQGATEAAAAPQQANVPSWRALERAGYSRAWAGQLATDDPSDAGPAYVYISRRPAASR